MDYQKYESFEDLFEKNQNIKKEEIKTINNFKRIYNIIKIYEPTQPKYNEIINNSDIRCKFLIDAIRIAFEQPEIDELTKDIILQMYEEIYNYLYKDSKLNEIEIPEDVINNLFNKRIIPSESQLQIVMSLIKENKRIFDTEIKGKYFSQTLDQGLHTGIIKELKIEEENLSHLLGLTNDGSLYEFYRKIELDNEIIKILSTLGVKNFQDPNFNIEQFNMMFKAKFGLDYTRENKIKIINWRYNAPDDYLLKRGIIVTEEERKALNETYHYAPKSQTLNFYCNDKTTNLLEKENNKIRMFIFEYIRKEIITKSKNKKTINELLKIYTKKDLESILNCNINIYSITSLISKYIEQNKYKFEEDKNFKQNFINEFGYSYPLINYYELLSKNISFYNFSIFKNLNSIIVDYNSFGKKLESDLFLVSYSSDKIDSIEKTISSLINEKNKKYEIAAKDLITDKTLDNNYIMNLISLLSFPEQYRYYFKYGFLSKEKQKQDNKIIAENSPKQHNITLIGFKASEDESTRLKNLEPKKRKRVKHFLKCETNITSNYHLYITDFVKNGIEYPIDILEERGNLPYNRKRKILKIIKPLDKLKKYILLFEFYKNNIDYDSENEIHYIKELGEKILKIIDNYQQMTTLKITIMKYRVETDNINVQELYKYRENIEKESITANKMNRYLNEYKEYIEETINYCESINHKRR